MSMKTYVLCKKSGLLHYSGILKSFVDTTNLRTMLQQTLMIWLEYSSLNFNLRVLILPMIKILSDDEELLGKKKVTLCHNKLHLLIKHGSAQREGFYGTLALALFVKINQLTQKSCKVLLCRALFWIVYFAFLFSTFIWIFFQSVSAVFQIQL